MAFKSQIEKFAKVRELLKEEEKKKGSDFEQKDAIFFKPPMPKNVSEQDVYTIRFLPIEESATGKPWVQMNYHMFQRPGDNKYIKVIDPRFFDPKAQNPIGDLAKELFGTGNELDKQKALKFYRKPRYFTLVYIKEAPEKSKDLVGKVLIFEAGVKLYAKLESAMKLQKMCFYDPFKGRDFLLVVKRGGSDDQPWANYDESAFMGDPTAIAESEEEMTRVSEVAEKIKIKEVLLSKDPIKSGEELHALLHGGVKTGRAETPVTDLVSGKSHSTTTVDIDYGSVPVTKTESKVSPKAEKKTTKAEPKVEAVVGQETSGDSEDFNVQFNDDDFKLP